MSKQPNAPRRRPIRSTSTAISIHLDSGWSLISTEPGAWAGPQDISSPLPGPDWSPAQVPGTVAKSVAPQASLDDHDDYDRLDWWYHRRFENPIAPDAPEETRVRLQLDGLATLAEVWLNGILVVTSRNMYVGSCVDITELLSAQNHLVIAFRSLSASLSERRPRPRWKTQLVREQKLRWYRTTLLGRIPGWTPAIAPVGPWRSVSLEVSKDIFVDTLRIRSDWDGDTGVLSLQATGSATPDVSLDSAMLRVGGHEFAASITKDNLTGGLQSWTVHADVRVPGVEPWWPRTHGEQRLYQCELSLPTSNGPVDISCGRIGFRSVDVDDSDGRIGFRVNGVEIFCRGACWTSNDVVSLVGEPAELKRTLELLADANANMVRVGGTMVYESDDFYRACDELGIMVWQDFMFANMDYPIADPEFAASIETEAGQQIDRLAAHPCVVAWCGGSEVEQQAAMFGAPREAWSSSLYTEVLPNELAKRGITTPYWPSTPTGGVLPFHVEKGLAHYYGVGAYLRPIDDARLSAVKFSPECLGFSHVPESFNLRSLAEGGTPPPHDPAWKRGVPRDSGAGWDFEDVRDHYLETVFGVDARGLRWADLERYRELSRIVTGSIMTRVFDEWRSSEHPNGGALVWFLRDLRPGAGWGIIDSGNNPKPVYWYLKRAWDPIRVAVLDRGLDGLSIEVHNETSAPLNGQLRAKVIDADGRVLVTTEAHVDVDPRSSETRHLEEMTGHFVDANHAYRFGPCRQVLVSAELVTDSELVGPTVFWVAPPSDLLPADLSAEWDKEAASVSVSTNRPARAVRLDVRGVDLDDNYFDLVPDSEIAVRSTTEAEHPFRGYVAAINAPDDSRIRTPDESAG